MIRLQHLVRAMQVSQRAFYRETRIKQVKAHSRKLSDTEAWAIAQQEDMKARRDMALERVAQRVRRELAIELGGSEDDANLL